MADGKIEFTIKIKVDEKEVDEAVKKRMDADDSGLPSFREGYRGYTRGRGPSPRKKYRTRKVSRGRAFREISSGLQGPDPSLAYNPQSKDNILGAGSYSAYEEPTGREDNITNIRGRIRGNQPMQAHPNYMRFIDRFRAMERAQLAARHERQEMKAKLTAPINKFTSLRGQTTALATNPQGVIQGHALSMLRGAGPYGFAATAAITAAVSTPEMAKRIIRFYGQKGGPLNRDWRYIVEETVYGMIALEKQKRRGLGLDGYIVDSTVGFHAVDESAVYNSQLMRDEIRLNLLTHEEKVRQQR